MYNKAFTTLQRSSHWKDYLKEETKENQSLQCCNHPLIYNINKGFDNDYKGYYISPILINYVAMWISPKYAVYVRKIMDQVNNRPVTYESSKDQVKLEAKPELKEQTIQNISDLTEPPEFKQQITSVDSFTWPERAGSIVIKIIICGATNTKI
ncbi:MAG: hypothetical protein EZS28_007080 [Streblomastix strix]|uniref:KilA-N domain-containing protein n=1 Tax=Streblomastix strix TaxID=222440 RepID=A0A5J4WRI2_9EUKA|nr:MAG: hypothetical protein EZS28_007080 [Streblomastix strix]